MTERRYTVFEIDALRSACAKRVEFGKAIKGQGFGYAEGAYPAWKTAEVEELVRTFMVAGITAEDIYEEDQAK